MNTRSREALRQFLGAVTLLVERTSAENALLTQGRALIETLIARDDWLPDELTRAHPTHYRQYLLYGDPLDRFSLVSFVWGPGQRTPIHDHTVWGIIGVLRGAEISQQYRITSRRAITDGAAQRLGVGEVAFVSPTIGDVHEVRNAFDDRVSVSIHLYGGNIGRISRHAFDRASGKAETFVSSYSNAMVPNVWWDAPG